MIESEHMRNMRLIRRMRAQEERERRLARVAETVWLGLLVAVVIVLVYAIIWSIAEASRVEAAVLRDHRITAENYETLTPVIAEQADEGPEMIPQGEFKLTFYCACRSCSGKWGHRTSSGATCTEGRTVATDYFPAGTQIYIEGYGLRTVEDTGVHGRHIDIFYEDHQTCKDLGIQRRQVWIVRGK